ncbi:helix-turn-helix domain-containing protein [Rhodococcus sp. BE178]|uniref:helix-turn-helix domain-containing protein n=1 Tax=Rhodococcus sp. BE178 TaxID=2817737 RepID=UPI003D1F5CDE
MTAVDSQTADHYRIVELVRLQIRIADKSHREVAEAIGVSTKTFARRITGERRFTALDLFYIAAYLGIDVSTFIPPDLAVPTAAAA